MQNSWARGVVPLADTWNERSLLRPVFADRSTRGIVETRLPFKDAYSSRRLYKGQDGRIKNQAAAEKMADDASASSASVSRARELEVYTSGQQVDRFLFGDIRRRRLAVGQLTVLYCLIIKNVQCFES